MKGYFLPLVLSLLASLAASQPPPPSAPGSGGQAKKFEGWPSISTLPATEPFASMEGRFRIALPKSISGFAALSPKQTGTNATGEQYTWKFAEGEIVFLFLDFPDSALSGSPADLAQVTVNSKNIIANRLPTAKLLSENQSTTNAIPSSYFIYDLGADGFLAVQLFLDKKRLYRFNAAFKDSKNEKFISSAFSSFRLIPQTEIDA